MEQRAPRSEIIAVQIAGGLVAQALAREVPEEEGVELVGLYGFDFVIALPDLQPQLLEVSDKNMKHGT